ncbi:MAG TPA: flavin reductase family protein [Pseudonocardia sp.]|jgi:flavin reductase (DIM6/NTAB) family NADH-FMN oxidoreductase RutF|nr:flavin reductase family protein [Pseudonocardia sp.]
MGEASNFDSLVDELDYPMLIVTAAINGEKSGCLVGFHTQASINPPRFLVCISDRNHTFSLAERSDVLAVHFLDQSDLALARLFGEHTGDMTDKFSRCSWSERLGLPVLAGIQTWFIGRIAQRLSFGDHIGYLLEPLEAHLDGELHQLAFQQVKAMEPGHPA